MNNFTFLLLAIFLVCSKSIYSQKKTESNPLDSLSSSQNKMTRWQMLKYDGSSTLDALLYTYKQPFKWKGKDWVKFGGVLAGTALISLLDEPSNDFFTGQKKIFLI